MCIRFIYEEDIVSFQVEMNSKTSSSEKAVYSSKKRNVSVITATVWSQFGHLMRTNEERQWTIMVQIMVSMKRFFAFFF